MFRGKRVPVSQLSSAFLKPKTPMHLQFAYYESSMVVEYVVERWGAEKGRGPEQLILIWVDDVDAQYDRVKSAGIDVKPPEDKPYGVRMFNVTDPEGYDWGFMQPTGKGYEQSEGGLTEVPAQS